MKVSYKKELGRSYMMLVAKEEEDVFSIQMLLENNIRGLLPYERRVFNGEAEYYYNITEKYSMESCLQEKLFGEKEVRKLLQSLYCIVGELHSYFLDPGGLLTDPEYIYMDADGCYFSYYPAAEKRSIEDVFVKFSERLQEQIDYEEEGAIQLTYRFYQMLKESQKGVLRILEDVLTEREESEEVVEEILVEEEMFWGEEEEEVPIKRIKPDIYTFIFFLSSLLVSICYLGMSSFMKIWTKPAGLAACVFVVISVFGMAAAFVDIDIVRKK